VTHILLVIALAATLLGFSPPRTGSIVVSPNPAHVGQTVTITVSGIMPGKGIRVDTGDGQLAFRDGNKDGVATFDIWYYRTPGTYNLTVVYESNKKFIASCTEVVLP
jgi:hypothetical protein